MHYIILNILLIIARGGGGGSGGGGHGGGGGSYGGGYSGSCYGGTCSSANPIFTLAIFGLILLSFLPALLIAKYIKMKHKGTNGCIAMLIISFIIGALWWLVGKWGLFISIGAFIGGPYGYFSNSGIWKLATGIGNSKNKLMQSAAASDPAWDPEKLNQRVQTMFIDFQNDWSTFNLTHMLTYVSENYGKHVGLMLEAIRLRGRRDQMDNVKLLTAYPVEMNDFPQNSEDNVTYLIRGQANDKLIEQVDGNDKLLFEDDSMFIEYWHFVRNGEDWMLDNISQATEDILMISTKIQDFAQQNGMYYSPDWGWLLLPSRGQLFKNGKFGTSDINNHVIGYYNKLLVELYSYVPNPNVAVNGRTKQYVIAQAALPKRYDSIVVQAKGSALGEYFKKIPKGYNKLSLEWPDFNKRYDVYATNVEQVTAFELLHPVYMEKLFALPFKVSIEVVDNVVYLYSEDMNADYATMYSLLQDAFKEMRM
jgi:hypothetical protein